jgi:hypothetical protein
LPSALTTTKTVTNSQFTTLGINKMLSPTIVILPQSSPISHPCPTGMMLLAENTTCQEFLNGTYGDNRTFHCACENGALCNASDGFCNCQPGWMGENCTEECPHYRYGAFCNLTCQCQNSAACDTRTGYCTCSFGYTGDYCETVVVNKCDPGYCLNGGTCQIDHGAPVCT